MGEADAQSTLAQIALGYTRIVSPNRWHAPCVRKVHEGALLSPGTEVDTITPLDAVFVTANFTERQITNPSWAARDRSRRCATCLSEARSHPACYGLAGQSRAADGPPGRGEDRPAHPSRVAPDLAETHLIGQSPARLSARVEVITDAAAREDTP